MKEIPTGLKGSSLLVIGATFRDMFRKMEIPQSILHNPAPPTHAPTYIKNWKKNALNYCLEISRSMLMLSVISKLSAKTEKRSS